MAAILKFPRPGHEHQRFGINPGDGQLHRWPTAGAPIAPTLHKRRVAPNWTVYDGRAGQVWVWQRPVTVAASGDATASGATVDCTAVLVPGTASGSAKTGGSGAIRHRHAQRNTFIGDPGRIRVDAEARGAVIDLAAQLVPGGASGAQAVSGTLLQLRAGIVPGAAGGGAAVRGRIIAAHTDVQVGEADGVDTIDDDNAFLHLILAA